jgi:hypothetical protein
MRIQERDERQSSPMRFWGNRCTAKHKVFLKKKKRRGAREQELNFMVFIRIETKGRFFFASDGIKAFLNG